jgi:hypothetical protein
MNPPDKCPHCLCNATSIDGGFARYDCGTVMMTNSASIHRQSSQCLANQRDQLLERVKQLESHITRLEHAGMHAMLPDANVIDRRKWDEAVRKRP